MVVVLYTLMTCQSRGFASSIDQGPGEMNTDAGGLSMDLKDPSNDLLGILKVSFGGERLAATYVAGRDGTSGAHLSGMR